MKYFLVLCLLVTTSAAGQNTLYAVIVDTQSNTPLPGATAQILSLKRGASADINGLIRLDGIPDDKFEIEFRFIGYRTVETEYTFPRERADTLRITLSPADKELGEITVSTTRSSRTISDIPTRIEVISAAELEEKATGQPSNIRTLLTESTGIQTQQTSPTSANATIRIQGLDGRYTQLLQDGFPLYSGFASGLSILQIPPLNLRRVEVVKGASSTLYGGGAIAGLINLVTKEPGAERELTFLANVNQTQALDLSGFYSQKYGKTGLTIYVARNTQAAYDVNKDGFSDLPQFTRYTFNPKLFVYLKPATTLSFGINSSFENRLGGDVQVITGNADNTHLYFERNKSDRFSTQFRLDNTLANGNVLTLKNSVGYFSRTLSRPAYQFGGHQVASFSEVSYARPHPVFEWVLGANLWTDQFIQQRPALVPLDYCLNTVGLFAQSNWKPTPKFVLETGLRTDYISRNKLFVLPRISALYKLSPHVTARVGGGLGYKAPMPFIEQAEELGFQDVRPVDAVRINNETSLGSNVDVTYRTLLFDAVSLSINQLFFYTRLNNSLVLVPTSAGDYTFMNAAGKLISQGLETNIKLTYDELSVYLGYTFIDAQTQYDPNTGGATSTQRQYPFTSRNRLYSTILYEVDEKLRLGYELFYVGPQTIRNGTAKPGYWLMGFSAERRWKHVSLFVNFENFTDTRQSRFEPSYSGPVQNPQFTDIWAPTDGFIYNGGFKLNL